MLIDTCLVIERSHLQLGAEPMLGPYLASVLLFGAKIWACGEIVYKFLLSQVRYSGTSFPLICLYWDLGSKKR